MIVFISIFSSFYFYITFKQSTDFLLASFEDFSPARISQFDVSRISIYQRKFVETVRQDEIYDNKSAEIRTKSDAKKEVERMDGKERR